VEHAAGAVRTGGQQLSAVLAALHPDIDFSAAFDLTPAVEAASPWIDRAVAHAAEVQTLLQD
jgi:hypothetical protein